MCCFPPKWNFLMCCFGFDNNSMLLYTYAKWRSEWKEYNRVLCSFIHVFFTKHLIYLNEWFASLFLFRLVCPTRIKKCSKEKLLTSLHACKIFYVWNKKQIKIEHHIPYRWKIHHLHFFPFAFSAPTRHCHHHIALYYEYLCAKIHTCKTKQKLLSIIYCYSTLSLRKKLTKKHGA